MCITKLLKHPNCGHWSCEITKSCKEGRNFSNCPSFTTGAARRPAQYQEKIAKEKTCPKCDKKDDYDGKKIRMIKKSVHATKFGLGPNVSNHLRPIFSWLAFHLTCDIARLVAGMKGSQGAVYVAPTRISSPKKLSDFEIIQRSDCGINLGRKTRKYGPKKEAEKMVLTEGGCVVM